MTDPNPIAKAAVAATTPEQMPVKNALEGAGFAQDVAGVVEGWVSGDWSAAAGDLLSFALGFKDFLKDPVEGALSMGIGWLIEHIGPVTDLLDLVTGNQNALELTVKTWEQIAEQVQTTAEHLTDSVNSACASWVGPAADGYRTWVQDQLDTHRALSDAARGVAAAVDISKTVLNGVRGFIRGLVSDLLAKAVKILYRYVPPAYPVAIAVEFVPLVVQSANAGVRVVNRMVELFQALVRRLGKLGELLGEAARRLARGPNAVAVAGRQVGPAIRADLLDNPLLARFGAEMAKESALKYAVPRLAKGAYAEATDSTDTGSQVDLVETGEKRERDRGETRIEGTKSGGVRITGEL